MLRNIHQKKGFRCGMGSGAYLWIGIFRLDQKMAFRRLIIIEKQGTQKKRVPGRARRTAREGRLDGTEFWYGFTVSVGRSPSLRRCRKSTSKPAVLYKLLPPTNLHFSCCEHKGLRLNDRSPCSLRPFSISGPVLKSEETDK